MKQLEEKFTFKGWQIAYTSEGEAEVPIIFIHGASSDKNIWKYLFDLRDSNQQFLALDLLGHGNSDKPEINYDDELWSNNVKSLLDYLNLSKVVLVAHSYGALIVKKFCDLYPDSIARIVLIDGKINQKLSDSMFTWMMSTLERSDYYEYMANISSNRCDRLLSEVDANMVSASVLNTPKHVLIGQIKSMREEEFEDTIIIAPVLAIYRNGMDWNQDEEMYLRNHTSNLELIVWDKISHFMMLEKPRELMNAIKLFINN